MKYLRPIDPKFPKGVVEGISSDGSTVVGASCRGPIPSRVRAAKLMPSAHDLRGTDAYEACLWRGDAVIRLGQLNGSDQTTLRAVSSDGSMAAGEATSVNSNSSLLWSESTSSFLWSKGTGIRVIDLFLGEHISVFGMSSDGRFVFGSSMPKSQTSWAFDTIWTDGKAMIAEDYLESLGVEGIKSWRIYVIRGITNGGRVLVGDAWTSHEKFVTFIVD